MAKKKRTKKSILYNIKYSTFYNMKARCNNPKNPSYQDYGARGIKVEFKSFDDFIESMGPRPEGMSVDRIDNNGNYCKENCRWATYDQQRENTRTNRWIMYNGKKELLCRLTDILKLHNNLVYIYVKKYNYTYQQAFDRVLLESKEKKHCNLYFLGEKTSIAILSQELGISKYAINNRKKYSKCTTEIAIKYLINKHYGVQL